MCFPAPIDTTFDPSKYPKPEIPSANPVMMLNKKALGYDQIILKMGKRHSLPTSKSVTATGSGVGLPKITT